MYCDRCGDKIIDGAGKMAQFKTRSRYETYSKDAGKKIIVNDSKIERILLCDMCFARLAAKLAGRGRGHANH